MVLVAQGSKRRSWTLTLLEVLLALGNVADDPVVDFVISVNGYENGQND